MQKLALYWIYEVNSNKKKKHATCLFVGIALFPRHLSGIVLNWSAGSNHCLHSKVVNDKEEIKMFVSLPSLLEN